MMTATYRSLDSMHLFVSTCSYIGKEALDTVFYDGEVLVLNACASTMQTVEATN